MKKKINIFNKINAKEAVHGNIHRSNEGQNGKKLISIRDALFRFLQHQIKKKKKAHEQNKKN